MVTSVCLTDHMPLPATIDWVPLPARCCCCRLHYEKLQQDLQQTSSTANQLAAENSQLKSSSGAAAAATSRLRRGVPGVGPGRSTTAPQDAGDDPLAAQQVTQQMQALLVEKSKLAAENDRLLRENTGLQVGGSGWMVQPSQRAVGDQFHVSWSPPAARDLIVSGARLAAHVCRSCSSSRWCIRPSWRGTASCLATMTTSAVAAAGGC